MRGGQGGIGANWGTAGGLHRNLFWDVLMCNWKSFELGAHPENEGAFAAHSKAMRRGMLGAPDDEEEESGERERDGEREKFNE
uniref:Uncharacterized protein n=1 Tax=Chromera velia CCMP2878 TaxID=1169474 RepID=A0A0G4F4T9_9ALVE|mmetsp:Transcript_1141/g.2406  ORF Transcript_1141/g.2406 Transcript_1141/m.2406 type:complete len:83 (+) Transcript_1141:3122-3370(+)|eukprot:Cvel_15229.t1-p1 / transcript=Cvel_15229.t1 / gene=Cvel_15229 / organism=Chromera_velia_CCMP2878 / gene_product=hypothetical protein / transcript_product=hypothetical protein / location=Cvel_scaffold1114:33495-33740(+) / protein_length=82 / sequence_SO=supercontig / SO=protein_coding / is_pseudo=false